MPKAITAKITKVAAFCALAAALAGCANTQPAHIILAPETEAPSVSAVVEVPKLMEHGSSHIEVDIGDNQFVGKMICFREPGSKTSQCQMTLVSGGKSIACELQGAHEDSTGTAKKVAQTLLVIPTLGISNLLLPDNLTPLGAGKCKANDGTSYAIQVAAPPNN